MKPAEKWWNDWERGMLPDSICDAIELIEAIRQEQREKCVEVYHKHRFADHRKIKDAIRNAGREDENG